MSKEERAMEAIAEAIAAFDASNPILVEFFKRVLHDPLILQKEGVLACLLIIAEELDLPLLISQESYKEALQKMEEMGIELYAQEVHLLIEKIGQDKPLEHVARIALATSGEEKEGRRVREYFGAMLYMIRFERQREATSTK